MAFLNIYFAASTYSTWCVTHGTEFLKWWLTHRFFSWCVNHHIFILHLLCAHKKIFKTFITKYFKYRSQLVNAFLLVDIRHEPQSIDLKFMEWLEENLIPFSIVFTKADKLNTKSIKKNINDYKSKMLISNWEEIPPIFITSAQNKSGSKEILKYINQLNIDYFDKISS